MMNWLKANSPHGTGELSHLSLAGGKYCLPTSLNGAFLIKYSRAIRAGEPLSIIERRTPMFHLFVDLDWATEQPVPAEQQLELASFVAQQAFLIYAPSNRDQQVVVATRKPGPRNDGLMKGGMHLHWPDILTDAATAQLFRETAVSRCRERFGDDLLPKPWEDVIDDHVFKGSGLRLLYSIKQDSGDAYKPQWLLRIAVHDEVGMGRPEIMGSTSCVDDIRHWVQTCSIRYHGVGKTPVRACVEDIIRPEGGQPLKDASLEKHTRPLEELRSVLPDCYSSCRFLKLLEGDHGKFILRTDSRTCLNLQPDGEGKAGAHKSNGIYFVIDRSETYQACFCNCETEEGRVHGPCRGFRSETWQTPARLADSLFPPASAEPFSSLTSKRATAEDMYQHFFNPQPKKKARQKASRNIRAKQ